MFYLYIEEFATTVIHMTTGTNTNRKEMMQIGVFNFAWQKNKIKLSVIFDIFTIQYLNRTNILVNIVWQIITSPFIILSRIHR